jgi:hypothetical protein
VTRLSGSDPLAVRASRKLRGDEALIASLGPTVLRKYLDEVPLWNGGSLPIRQLVLYFARYLYLPRLTEPAVLLKAISDGLGILMWREDTFAYADSFDSEMGRYRGLRGDGHHTLTDIADPAWLVKPDVAARQIERERLPPVVPPPGPDGGDGPTIVGPDPDLPPIAPPPPPRPTSPKRYPGTVVLDEARVGRDAGKIADEVIAHLNGLVGARVKVTLEIEADIPSGAPEQVVRAVTENGRSLKFVSQGFEQE